MKKLQKMGSMIKAAGMAVFLLGMSQVVWGFMDTSYYQAGSNVFVCTSTQTLTTQAGFSSTLPVLTLYNPPYSSDKLVILDTGIDITATPVAAAGFSIARSTYNVVIATTSNQGRVSSVIVNASTASASGLCYSSATLAGTPVPLRFIGGTSGASATTAAKLIDETNGKIVVMPGNLITIQSSSAAQILAHFTYLELPL